MERGKRDEFFFLSLKLYHFLPWFMLLIDFTCTNNELHNFVHRSPRIRGARKATGIRSTDNLQGPLL